MVRMVLKKLVYRKMGERERCGIYTQDGEKVSFTPEGIRADYSVMNQTNSIQYDE